MATLTSEQIEQKKQLLAEKVKEMKALINELVEAGDMEISDKDLEKATGGHQKHDYPYPGSDEEFQESIRKIKEMLEQGTIHQADPSELLFPDW